MQYRFGVSIRLLRPGKHQIQRRLKRDMLPVKSRRHVPVIRIARILSVHHRRHLLENPQNIIFPHDAVTQPIGQMLARYPQSGPVFHQTHIVVIRHF